MKATIEFLKYGVSSTFVQKLAEVIERPLSYS